jgi:hypothetical protein
MEGEYAYRAQPYTFVLRSDLRIFKIYNGWYFVGRPTNEELRHDLRTIMESRPDYLCWLLGSSVRKIGIFSLI